MFLVFVLAAVVALCPQAPSGCRGERTEDVQMHSAISPRTLLYTINTTAVVVFIHFN